METEDSVGWVRSDKYGEYVVLVWREAKIGVA